MSGKRRDEFVEAVERGRAGREKERMSGKIKERRDAEVMRIGSQMSNVCYNLAQMDVATLPGSINQINLMTLAKQWDAARDRYRKSSKRWAKGRGERA
jgi:hypothetical protein